MFFCVIDESKFIIQIHRRANNLRSVEASCIRVWDCKYNYNPDTLSRISEYEKPIDNRTALKLRSHQPRQTEINSVTKDYKPALQYIQVLKSFNHCLNLSTVCLNLLLQFSVAYIYLFLMYKLSVLPMKYEVTSKRLRFIYSVI